ncbi:MAG: hypothetical protein Q9197_000112 [Variospora fuerteventurae]
MAGQIPLSGGNPTARPNTIGSGGGSISMAQQRSGETSIGVGSSGPGVGMSQQNLNGIMKLPDHVGLKTKSHSERAKRAQNLGSTTYAQR